MSIFRRSSGLCSGSARGKSCSDGCLVVSIAILHIGDVMYGVTQAVMSRTDPLLVGNCRKIF